MTAVLHLQGFEWITDVCQIYKSNRIHFIVCTDAHKYEHLNIYMNKEYKESRLHTVK